MTKESTIVQELGDEAIDLENYGSERDAYGADLCRRAAAEIKRLHGQVAQLHGDFAEERSALRAEIKRLKDCLREIGLGRQPMDYGRWEVACERLAGSARFCLETAP